MSKRKDKKKNRKYFGRKMRRVFYKEVYMFGEDWCLISNTLDFRNSFRLTGSQRVESKIDANGEELKCEQPKWGLGVTEYLDEEGGHVWISDFNSSRSFRFYGKSSLIVSVLRNLEFIHYEWSPPFCSHEI